MTIMIESARTIMRSLSHSKEARLSFSAKCAEKVVPSWGIQPYPESNWSKKTWLFSLIFGGSHSPAERAQDINVPFFGSLLSIGKVSDSPHFISRRKYLTGSRDELRVPVHEILLSATHHAGSSRKNIRTFAFGTFQQGLGKTLTLQHAP